MTEDEEQWQPSGDKSHVRHLAVLRVVETKPASTSHIFVRSSCDDHELVSFVESNLRVFELRKHSFPDFSCTL